MIDRQEIRTLSNLCRIDCPDETVDALYEDLRAIIAHADSLREIDTENVPECNHVLGDIANVMREDVVEPSPNREWFLENAPEHVGGMIRVPPVIRF